MSFVRRLEIARTWIAASDSDSDGRRVISVTVGTSVTRFPSFGEQVAYIHVDWDWFDALYAEGFITDHVVEYPQSGSAFRYAVTRISGTAFVEVVTCR